MIECETTLQKTLLADSSDSVLVLLGEETRAYSYWKSSNVSSSGDGRGDTGDLFVVLSDVDDRSGIEGSSIRSSPSDFRKSQCQYRRAEYITNLLIYFQVTMTRSR